MAPGTLGKEGIDRHLALDQIFKLPSLSRVQMPDLALPPGPSDDFQLDG